MSKLLTSLSISRKALIALLLLVILGGILRFHQLSDQSYWMDEGYTVNAVLSVVENGSTVLDSGQKYFCPTYCYPTALIVEKYGDSPSSYRILATLMGVLFIITFFFFTRRLINTNIALLTSFFITFSYWQIAWSRQARWYTLFALLFWLALYFFYRLREDTTHKWRNAALTTIFTTAAILTHGLGYLLPLIFIIWVLVDGLLLRKNLSFKTIGGLAILGTLFLIAAESRIGLVSNISFHYELPYYLSFYLRSYWLFIGLGVIGFFSLYETHKKMYLFLFTVLLTYLIPLSFLTNIVHYRYLFHITPIFFIFGALGIWALHQEIKPLWARTALGATLLVLFAAIGGGVFIPQTHYYLESDSHETLGDRPHYAYTPQPNWHAAYNFIKQERSAEDIIISSHPHFNKIFLDEAGYWIKFNYLGFDNRNEYSKDDREFYVNAKIVDDLEELKLTTATTHGFIIYDYMAADGRISQDILTYIEENFNLVFEEETNPTSQVWVYQF